MKNCPMCGHDANDDAPKCEGCGYNYANLGPGLGASRPAAGAVGTEGRSQPILEQRPNGTTPMVTGWICLVIAVVLAVMSLSGPSSSDIEMATGTYPSAYFAERVATAYARQWLFQIAAGGFFSLFLILWSVGYIVKAISFLPTSNSKGS